MKMDLTVSSETSETRTQTPGNYPKRKKLQLEHGESLETRILLIFFFFLQISTLYRKNLSFTHFPAGMMYGLHVTRSCLG